MKKLFFIVCLIGISAAMLAQNKSIDRVFDKYAGQEGFTTVYISKYMFSMFANLDEVEDEEMKEVQDVFGKLTGIKILAVEDGETVGKFL
ncbi:DUF4252 domain-containing protein [Bacteroidota bacterium]